MTSTKTAKKKSNRPRFRLTKQQPCTCITLFPTFLCRHCTSRTWKCIISRFVEDVNTRQQLSELWYNLLEFNSRKKISNIWRIERDGISAIKFEAARLHFSSDVFVAVAVVVAQAPCSRDTKPPCWRGIDALGQDKQRKWPLFKMNWVFSSCCPSVPLSL